MLVSDVSLEMINLALIFVPIILSIIAQSLINSKYYQYLELEASCGKTGAQIADEFLKSNGIYDVKINCIRGELTDHYDPTNKTMNLSSKVYYGKSVSSLAIACHETGHAIQHATKYKLIGLRSALVKPVSIANSFSWILILLGILFGALNLFLIGIILFIPIAIFQLVTLPVELNASKRAENYLGTVCFDSEEQKGIHAVLKAAAFTYLVGLITSLAQIARLLLIFTSSRKD